MAQENIETTVELPGPLSWPWTPAKSEFGSALIMCVQTHDLLCPLNENPGSAPVKQQFMGLKLCADNCKSYR